MVTCTSEPFSRCSHPERLTIRTTTGVVDFLAQCMCPRRRADQLMQEENHDVIPYCIATGDVRKLVNFFTARGQLNEALLVAQV